MYHPTDKITHTTAFITPVVGHWLEREIAQWVHVCGFLYVCEYICVYVCVYMCVGCVYVCVCVCLYVCVCGF